MRTPSWDEMTELIARALWDVVPYARAFGWDEHPSEDTREHYRDRARKLQRQFYITRRISWEE